MRIWRWIAAALGGVLLSLLCAGSAAAELGPIQLVSKSATEQAEEALAPEISADGRYLAFQGTIDGRRGVFRKDLETGEVATVAAGSAYEEEEESAADARAPSISADGRYVSFTTSAPLDPAEDTEPHSSDVYVADMSTSPPTYELASVGEGSSQALSGGSLASPRMALSADGRKVVFINGGQVYLRDLDERRTTLVSVRRNSETGAMEPGVPVPGGAVLDMPSLPLLDGAALSSDGTTVAWLGADLQEQVPLLAGEARAISEEDSASTYPYDEPLWRRVADGPQAPTRRIVGGEPSNPLSDLTEKNTDLNAAEGWLGVPGVDGVPQLSADGSTVALIGNPTEASNVFVVDMSEGLSRIQAVRQLTREVAVNTNNPAAVINREPYVPLNGHIYDLAISADGKRITFATARQQFPLAPPNLVSSPPSSLGLVELYLIGLEGETLQRLTHGDGGTEEPSLAPNESGQAGYGATSPSFGGDQIAFASTASNLVQGDGNEASDVFVLEDSEAQRGPGAVSISPPPPPLAIEPHWQLSLSASSLADGAVRLVATVPGAGSLRARVETALVPGEPPRRLDAMRAAVTSAGPAALNLVLPRRYRRLARSREGLYATARVAFRGAGGRPLHGELEVRFHVHRGGHGGRR
ncbi:MAG: hypothetical protein WB507_08215 [Solirubrobacterales bacterium]